MNIREKGRILLESEEKSPGPASEQCARVRVFYNMHVHGMGRGCLRRGWKGKRTPLRAGTFANENVTLETTFLEQHVRACTYMAYFIRVRAYRLSV